MKPDVAMSSIKDGLRAKAEPQEMLADVHAVILYYLRSKGRKDLDVVLRKPKNDPYTRTYRRSLVLLSTIENMLQYIVGGPLLFEQNTVIDESILGQLFGEQFVAILNEPEEEPVQPQ